MLDWNDLRHFVVLAREGTLSAAARTLGVDHATVARRVAALEKATALKLVDRRARNYALTEDGRRIAVAASAMEEAAFSVERATQAAESRICGEVAISAPPSLANALVAPRLVDLKREHPGIFIKLIGERRSASLSRREADLALRLSRPTEGGLFARKIGHFGFSLYGAASYLRETPSHAFRFIAYDESMKDAPQQQWLEAVADGREIVMRCNDLENQATAARAGLGLAALPHFLGDGDPRLERHEAGRKEIGRDVWLLVHRDLRRVPAVRVVMAFLVDCLKAR
jgi:DNA-binding transcriptional LysR family regulator